jgi:hypothetical protein
MRYEMSMLRGGSIPDQRQNFVRDGWLFSEVFKWAVRFLSAS